MRSRKRANCLEKRFIFHQLFEGSKIIMIMPANYSVIAENELTYVDGGTGFHFYVDYIDDGGEVLATNLVKYIGVGYLGKVLTTVIDPWFQPEADATKGIKGALSDGLKELFQGQVTGGEDARIQDKIQYGISNTIGVASALWVLGTQDGVVDTAGAAGSLTLK
jgi:hypothetical protein